MAFPPNRFLVGGLLTVALQPEGKFAFALPGASLIVELSRKEHARNSRGGLPGRPSLATRDAEAIDPLGSPNAMCLSSASARYVLAGCGVQLSTRRQVRVLHDAAGRSFLEVFAGAKPRRALLLS